MQTSLVVKGMDIEWSTKPNGMPGEGALGIYKHGELPNVKNGMVAMFLKNKSLYNVAVKLVLTDRDEQSKKQFMDALYHAITIHSKLYTIEMSDYRVNVVVMSPYTLTHSHTPSLTKLYI